MKKLGLKLLLFLFLFAPVMTRISNNNEVRPHINQTDKIKVAINKLPLCFTENIGQLDKSVRYYLKIPKGNVYFTPEEIVYQFIQRKGERKNQENSLFRE